MTLVSFVAWPTGRLGTWRADDYAAYKVARLIAGRRIRGSAWIPTSEGPRRVSNAHRDQVHRWVTERALASVRDLAGPESRPVLVPFPGWARIVGAPPSGSRVLAQALAARSGLRMLDVLRWRQRMNGERPGTAQLYFDNLVATGSPFRAECVLVADFVAVVDAIAAAAALLDRMGSRAVLAVSAARRRETAAGDPFATMTERVADEIALAG